MGNRCSRPLSVIYDGLLRMRRPDGTAGLVAGRVGVAHWRRIEQLLRPAGMSWITALRSPDIAQLIEERGPWQIALFDECGLIEVESERYPGERLVVCRNPALAEERARKREELLQATERDLDAVVAASGRARRPLRGQDAIGLRVGRVVNAT
jgi:hypothetical protein